MKVALYARYSSDAQRDASIADQLRECRAHAERQGWQIVEEYTDHAVSGASLLRPGIQALMADAAKGRFQCVVAEAMDRLSRDQEDIAGLFKRMAFGSVKIITLSEGEVSQLHVGLKGTMNALFLKDLADKTRRGLRGRIEQGKSGGGNAYGYTVVKRLDGDGEAVRGDRVIHPEEAAVVVRIMRDFAAGKSAKRIATELNRDGVRAPSGGHWGFSTINGNPKRGTGILNNELYIGKLVWNRQRFLKDPTTGRRQARLNAPEEWLSSEVPHLRIVDDELWAAVKGRQRTQRGASLEGNVHDKPRLDEQRRARYLLSGLTRCGKCGGGYSMISSDMLGCSTARNKGTCANRVNIRRDELERRVLTTLHSHLMDPALFAEFCDEFTRELNRIRMEGGAAITAAKAEVDRLERDMDATIDMMIRLGPSNSTERLSAKVDRLDARQKALQSFLAEAKEPPALLHPEMAGYYRRQVAALHELLERGPEIERMKASEILRSLVSAIVLMPADDGLRIDVQGDLAGILEIATAQNAKNPGVFTSGMSQLKMVAGTGFEPVTFRL
jgi:site-specific DNA recombinase